MATVLIYFPHETERFEDATNVELKNGVLTFYSNESASNKKITTNAVFRIEEKVGA
jgi:hypothetical protein